MNDYTYAIYCTLIQNPGNDNSINRLSFSIRTSDAAGLGVLACVATNKTTGETITSGFKDSEWFNCGPDPKTGGNPSIFNFSYQSGREGILLQQAASQEGA